jgi:DtxR family Mn-dependent transcriptional regulator
MSAPDTRLTGRLEDYLEAVLMLVRAKGAARVRDIAASINVSKPSVTAALKQLAEGGLVHYDPYEWVTLTVRGRAIGRRIRHKHDALRLFLSEVLGVEEAAAEANACRMEHVVDNQVLARMSLLADFVHNCPPGSRRWVREFLARCRQKDAPAGAGDGAGRAGQPPSSSQDR